MTDEQLHDELERRSKSASHGADWPRHDLLPAVSAGIDARPQRVATSRGPALAGLAGAAAIILVLVVALPRIGSGPQAPASNNASMDVSAPPSTTVADDFRVLSATEFADALAAGELRSSTVVVDGQIGEGPPRGLFCGPVRACYRGPLAGTDPEIDLFSDWIAAPAGEGNEAETRTWPWWTLPSGSDSWPMLLKVDENGRVSYLGYAVGSEGAPTWTVRGMLDVDPSTRSPSQAFVVDGWLNETEPPGRQITIDCMSPSISPVAGLPTRYCQAGDTLTTDPVDSQNPLGYGSGQSISVQRSAAQQFGGDGSSPGLFVISPRLYAGCIDTAPCWYWDVIARLTQTTDSARTPTPPATSTQSPVLEPQAFVTSLMAGALTGQTVLVNGTIGELESVDGSALCKDDDICLMGRLQRTDPEVVNIYGRPIDTTEDDPAAKPRTDGGWPWVNAPLAPVSGTLVLSVEEDDTVEFIGLSANGDRPNLSAEEMSQLSVDTATPDDTYVVDGWLTADLIEPPCAAPDPGTFIGELPNRWCGGPDWLVDGPVNIQAGPPPGGLGVQSGAYRDFAPDPTQSGSVGEPRFGSYLVSKRLEGWCDGATPPCWQWEVVGRLSETPVSDPTATPIATVAPPTSEPGLAIECSPAPADVTWPADPTIRDTTGLIDSCEAVKPSSFTDEIDVSNPDDDLAVLRVTWSGAPCDAAPEFVFSESATGYSLEGVSTWNGACILPLVQFEVRLHLTAEVDAQGVTPSLTQVTVMPSPTPTTMACAEDSLNIPMSLSDDTALVTSCEQTPVTMFPVGGDLLMVSNTGGPWTLQVLWRQPACFGPVDVRFVSDDSGGYRLTLIDSTGPPVTCIDGTSDYVRRGVVLHLLQPISADSVSVVQ